MALVLTDEQTMLRDNARGFLSKNAPIAHLRQLRDSRAATGFSPTLWQEFVAMGWAGILIPQEYDGLGVGDVESGVVMEELGRTLTPSPFLSTAILGATALAHFGAEKQKREYLPRFAVGELLATLAVDESTKHRPDKIALSAEHIGSGYALKGAKTFVIDGHVADLLIVAARTSGAPGDKRGITIFLVESRSPGVRAERTPLGRVATADDVALTIVGLIADNDFVTGQTVVIDGGYSIVA